MDHVGREPPKNFHRAWFTTALVGRVSHWCPFGKSARRDLIRPMAVDPSPRGRGASTNTEDASNSVSDGLPFNKTLVYNPTNAFWLRAHFFDLLIWYGIKPE